LGKVPDALRVAEWALGKRRPCALRPDARSVDG